MISHRKKLSCAAAAALFLCTDGGVAQAQELERPTIKELQPEDDKAIFSIVFENDIFGGTDQNYTNGVRFAWLNAEETTPDWARWAANHLLPFPASGKTLI